MDPVRHRLSEFCEINSVEKQTVRSIIARNEAPFWVETFGGKQLTYGSAEYLAWCLYVQLRNMGIPAPYAAEAIRLNKIVEQVFNAYDRDEDLGDLFLIIERQEKRLASGDVRSIWTASLQPLVAVTEILSRGASSHGTTNPNGERRLGLSGATIVPVLPCLERCEAALDAKGYSMQGRNLYDKA